MSVKGKPGENEQQPNRGPDGTLYFSLSDTTSGSVIALITDSSGLAHQGWPKGFHDNRNTSNFQAPLPGSTCQD